MSASTDWRLTNQEKYLRGVKLCLRIYIPSSAENDHDHCEFCWAKFMAGDAQDVLHQGYSTDDGYRWICEKCFADFPAHFGWKIANA
jgi:hypothetical protein